MSDLFARGMAASYRAGREHIRKLNADRKLSATRLTDSGGVMPATDKGTVPASSQRISQEKKP